MNNTPKTDTILYETDKEESGAAGEAGTPSSSLKGGKSPLSTVSLRERLMSRRKPHQEDKY